MLTAVPEIMLETVVSDRDVMAMTMIRLRSISHIFVYPRQRMHRYTAAIYRPTQ